MYMSLTYLTNTRWIIMDLLAGEARISSTNLLIISEWQDTEYVERGIEQENL